MKCPYCQHTESRVIDSRYTDGYSTIRRRRECLRCEERFTTYERIEDTPLLVIKKNQEREFFDKNKLLHGIMKATEKRQVSKQRLKQLVNEIEKEIRNRMCQEITSQKIGQMVMEKLKELDEVAYVRFASVYRQFKDVSKFKEELDRLLDEE